MEEKGSNFGAISYDKPISPSPAKFSPNSNNPFMNMGETVYSVAANTYNPVSTYQQGEFRNQDKYGLDSIKVDHSKLGYGGTEAYKSENIKTSFTNSVSNAYNTNSILPDFPN